jgi:hypothetical protein
MAMMDPRSYASRAIVRAAAVLDWGHAPLWRYFSRVRNHADLRFRGSGGS